MGILTLIRDISGTPTDGNIYAIPTKNIITGPLADIYDQYGQQWGHEGTYYTYWNGSNWQTILLNTEFGSIDCDYEIIDDEEETEDIINDYHESEFIEEVRGKIYYQGKKHKYSHSRWQGNPWAFEVED